MNDSIGLPEFRRVLRRTPAKEAVNEFGQCLGQAHSPPCEEGWLRHQENVGEAHRNAADGVVAYKLCLGVSDHPVRSIKGGFAAFSLCRVHPSSRGGEYALSDEFIHSFRPSKAGACAKAGFPTRHD
jgi:hypothetical protein